MAAVTASMVKELRERLRVFYIGREQSRTRRATLAAAAATTTTTTLAIIKSFATCFAKSFGTALAVTFLHACAGA